jgi:hypothetical protein
LKQQLLSQVLLQTEIALSAPSIFVKNDGMLSTLSLICILWAALSLCGRRGQNLSGIICKRWCAARTFYYFSPVKTGLHRDFHFWCFASGGGRVNQGGWMAPSLHCEARRRAGIFLSFCFPIFKEKKGSLLLLEWSGVGGRARESLILIDSNSREINSTRDEG